MSICSRRYASKSVQLLSRLRLASASPSPSRARQPLLFLYPQGTQCFKHASARRYHTELALGQGHGRSVHSKTPRTTLRAPCHTNEEEGRRYFHQLPASSAELDSRNSKRLVKSPAKTQTKSTAQDPEEETLLARRILVTRYRKPDAHNRISFRKVVPEPDRKIAYYLQDVDAEAHFSQLRASMAHDREPEVRSNVSRHALPTRRVRQLCGSTGPNMWIHHDGSGCIVRVRPGHDRSQCHVELEGSERAREITLKHLKRFEADVVPQPELEWMECVRTFSPYSDIRSLPHPPRWTLRTFKLYINALTSDHDYRSAMRYVHQGTEHRHQVVGDLLEQIFNDQSITRFASTRALQTALSFCRQHPELSNTAKNVWHSALSFGLQPDISCFNTDLSRCLVVRDFDRYRNLLVMMRAKNVQPDSTTFSLILRYAKNPNLRRRILHVVEQANLQHQCAHPSITSATIKQEVPHYLRRPDGLALLDERMTKTFGENWLTTRNVERLLRACRIRRPNSAWASDVLAIVQKAQSSNVSLDVHCMTELFRIAKKAGNLEDALEILKSRPMQQVQGLNQELLESFFLLAWRKQHFNLCRLIWFHAATQGRITRKMQTMVQRSLQSNICAGDRPDDRAWLLLAGKVIVNASLNPEQARTMFPHLAQHDIKSSPVEWLLEWTADSGARHEQMQLCQLLLEQDLHAWRFNEPLQHHDFMLLLDKAIALDNEWITTDKVRMSSPVDLLCSSLGLPRRQRAEPITIPSTNTYPLERRHDFVVNDHKLSYDTFVPLDLKDDVDIVDHSAAFGNQPAECSPSAVDNTPKSDLQLNQLVATDNHHRLEKAREDADEPQRFDPLVVADEEASKVFHHAVYS